MKSLVIKCPWSLSLLLLLLLLPLKLQGDYWDSYEYEIDPEVRDYLRELYSTGPTKPPTKERIKEKILADPDRPLYDDDYCNSELMFRNIHYRQLCYPEHYFVAESYSDLRKACYGQRVKCKNKAMFCRRSMTLMKGIRCVLVEGKKLPECSYKSIFVTGYAVVTCQWDSDSEEFIPNNIVDILVPR